MAKITNKLVQELNERVGGNKHQLHSNLRNFFANSIITTHKIGGKVH
jgi:hypothetical protein